jgi:hypothetical protein
MSVSLVPPGGDAGSSSSSSSVDDIFMSAVRTNQSLQSSPHEETRKVAPKATRLAQNGKKKAKDGKKHQYGYAACSYEWRGYQTPMAVLGHFGYAQAFVEDMIQTCSDNNESINQTDPYQPTFAVRGATVGRPESYCLCYDAEPDEEKLKDDDDYDEEEEEGETTAAIRIHQEAQLRRKNKLKRETQRMVLPRVLQDSKGRFSQPRRRGLQFLNANGSHAVFMTTPRFDCGPLTEPVTIFCVGVATEDGCFLSGLSHRFEFGHLYPKTPRDEAIQFSPVTIALHPQSQQQQLEEESAAAAAAQRQGSVTANTGSTSVYNSSDDDSSHDCSNSNPADDIKCECVFHGISDKLSQWNEDEEEEDSEDMNSTPDRIHRGM